MTKRKKAAGKKSAMRKKTKSVPPEAAPKEPDTSEKKAIQQATTKVDARPPRLKVNLGLNDNGQVAQVGADHSDALGWTKRLQDVFGSCGTAFPIMGLNQLIAASRNMDDEIDNARLNGMIAMVDGAKPTNEREAMLACQMAVTHNLAMTLINRAQRADQIPQVDCAGNLAVKLLRTYTAQAEILAKLQRDHSQTVRVEHVHVHSGGQAIVGNVSQDRSFKDTPGRGQDENQNQPHAKAEVPAALPAPGVAPMQKMRSPDAERDAVPVTCGQGETSMPDARRRQG